MIFQKVQASSWDSVSKAQEKSFFDFEFITWMAWKWQTASFFLFILFCIICMIIWEKRDPGGNPRKGILTLDTTRGDRLFISLLSAAFIHLAWLGLTDFNLWFATIISAVFSVFVFKFV